VDQTEAVSGAKPMSRLLHMDAHRARASGGTATGHVGEQIFSLGRSSFRRSPAASTKASTGEFPWPAGIDQKGLALTCTGEMGPGHPGACDWRFLFRTVGCQRTKPVVRQGLCRIAAFYYAHVGQVFCFSNTLRILRLVQEVSRELDESFLGDFLIKGWNVDPSRTVYRDIRRLPAGHLVNFSNHTSNVRCFLKLPIEEPLQLKRPEEYLELTALY
jgi:hypothetical protein